MYPRLEKSPPATPMMTLFFTTSGAAVIALAFLRSPTATSQITAPGLSIERDQVRVERAHVEPVAEDREAAVHGTAADRAEKFGGRVRR